MSNYILVEHLTSINSVICDTFKSTKRIKLTCFDVSEEYIVFGASSGGIYIFKREPCEFLKLIPSKEGSAIQIVISPNGKNIAITSLRGLVIILEDFLDPNVIPLIHSEHEGSTVTAIKWHGNTIYSGDDTGRVAVFFLSNLLTIFQIPSSILLHLDSKIVQIDTYLNYLLVSTKTRTYLCDTEKECYKQIGRKLRDGNYGACFFNATDDDSSDKYQSFKGIFKTINEDEHLLSPSNINDVKIYCARPGARLWEANFEATVVITHQFRDSLNQCPSNLLHLGNTVDTKMKVTAFKDVGAVPKDFNFCKIYPISNTFILTFDKSNIYIFDPAISKLMFWSCFKNINQVAIFGDYIYIWRDNVLINVLSLELLEDLIVKALLNKQYYFCAELCTNYHDEVTSLIAHSKKIHLISILKTKLIEISATELLEKLLPILQNLEKFNRDHAAGKRLSNGIVIVENSYSEVLSSNTSYIPESVQNFKDPLNLTENTFVDTKDATASYTNPVKEQSIENTKTENYKQHMHKRENISHLTLYKQFQLNKTHRNAELTESVSLMNALSLDDLFMLLQSFIQYVDITERPNASHWCKEQLLKQASKKNVEMEMLKPNTFSFLTDAFLEICDSRNLSCKCNFPLPKAHKTCPKYYDLGCKLLSCCEDVNVYLSNIPYMHKYVLSKITKLNDIVANLNLIVQFSDKDIFKQLVKLFTYDVWDEVIRLQIRLCKGQCLNCGSNIEIEDVCLWSDLGIVMIQSIGPQNTTKLLKRHSQFIPNGSFDRRFYQCCLLASTVEYPSRAVNFMDTIVTGHVVPKFEEQMEKFLQKRYLGCQNQVTNLSNNTTNKKGKVYLL
ncbi:hypothetical protein NQ315_013561 [Exocentrus adspersus]|uniref:Hermansky-Pudlak syndrome 5 protein homolog n=1 Tax=Exocentrus adspersus TaxID=1586481 RepID=A0AAV8VBR0_9CUCU|nr:hypothetical protein NQ315_013561 [Exocentrus adspersus]